MYKRKTQDGFVIQGNYGYGDGYEDLTTYLETEFPSRKEAIQTVKKDLKEYQITQSGMYRIVYKRFPIEEKVK